MRRTARCASHTECGVADMKTYRLNDDLSFCRIDGRPIFLDTRDDRYFRLSKTLERVFDTHVEGGNLAPDDIAHLVQSNILTDAPSLASVTRASIPTALRSALESSSLPTPHGIGAVAELLGIVLWMQLQLKMRSLKEIIDDVTVHRSRRLAFADDGAELNLLKETHVFLKARKFVPLDTRCLLDSLSMVTFLARRHLHANIVFGVTGDPFTAHCWVQAGELILSDTIGNTRNYTAIRVI